MDKETQKKVDEILSIDKSVEDLHDELDVLEIKGISSITFLVLPNGTIGILYHTLSKEHEKLLVEYVVREGEVLEEEYFPREEKSSK